MARNVRVLIVDEDLEGRADAQRRLVKRQLVVAGACGYGAQALDEETSHRVEDEIGQEYIPIQKTITVSADQEHQQTKTEEIPQRFVKKGGMEASV